VKTQYVTWIFLGLLSLTSTASAQSQPLDLSRRLPALPPLGSVTGLPGYSQKEAQPAEPGAQQGSTSGTIYKMIMPDGSVTYSDKPISGAKIEKKLTAVIRTSGIRLSSGSSEEKSGVLVSSSSLEESKAKKIEAAEKSLKKALEQQKEASEFLEADRKFSNNKSAGGKRTSRLSEEYFDRQAKAADAVNKAKQQLEAAQYD
jgi:hypothetical protein